MSNTSTKSGSGIATGVALIGVIMVFLSVSSGGFSWLSPKPNAMAPNLDRDEYVVFKATWIDTLPAEIHIVVNGSLTKHRTESSPFQHRQRITAGTLVSIFMKYSGEGSAFLEDERNKLQRSVSIHVNGAERCRKDARKLGDLAVCRINV